MVGAEGVTVTVLPEETRFSITWINAGVPAPNAWVVALATELGVPALAVVGRVFDGMDERVPTISLVERFGEERAMHDTAACIEEAVAGHLATLA